ncbi:stage II sporulation protein R [Rossellomorea aquimaris]|uniref:stage II sporulation protein R n=1 Tax=Rossellomorea aquimaris TaxID=189382 RepID=UPI001CD590D1|nr:stage II sporulation protein R [Rossellomorea aquimaris]MCA1055096.1 stage II sporulation protein R [Rossellomorea aquimaris]
MKTKHAVLMYILILTLGTILSLYIPKQEIAAEEPMVIPEDAIRLRILANSDLESDQNVKRLVRDEVNKEITKWVGNLTSQDEAKAVIQAGLPELKQIAEDVVAAEGLNQSVHIEFGKVQFPTKLYGQYLYPAGEYEAVLITLGKGEGANWWCVLYPPLCFLDFSTGNAVRSPGFETTVEANGDVVTEVDAEDEAVEADDDVVTEVNQQDEVMEESAEVEGTSVEQSEETEVVEVPSSTINENNVMEELQTKNEEPAAKEQVFVEEGDGQEVEKRFFVVDLFKGLFK